jgi:hypothetical protein
MQKDANPMTTRNVCDFLQEFAVSDLKRRGVLNQPRNLLNNEWFLDDQGEFSNKTSREHKAGSVYTLQNPGELFWDMNKRINPHYKGNGRALKFPVSAPSRGEGKDTIGSSKNASLNIGRKIGDALRGFTKMPNRSEVRDTTETGEDVLPNPGENVTIIIDKLFQGPVVGEGVLQQKVTQTQSNEGLESFGFCPNCGKELQLNKTPNFCPHCSEKLSSN